jgi:uncharacterized protein YkwD
MRVQFTVKRYAREARVVVPFLVASLAGRVEVRAQSAALDIEVDGAMTPVTARIVLSCTDPDGGPMAHMVSFSEGSDYEIVRDSRISISRTFRRTTKVRGLCRDAGGGRYPSGSRTVIAVDAALERDSVVALSNAERTRAGLAPLVPDTALDGVAGAHAQDMAERSYLSHVTPEGNDLAARLQVTQRAYRAAGENIAGNESARRAVRSWLTSRDHRANLLSPDYERIGVGVYRTPASPYTYYVQVFAK